MDEILVRYVYQVFLISPKDFVWMNEIRLSTSRPATLHDLTKMALSVQDYETFGAENVKKKSIRSDK